MLKFLEPGANVKEGLVARHRRLQVVDGCAALTECGQQACKRVMRQQDQPLRRRVGDERKEFLLDSSGFRFPGQIGALDGENDCAVRLLLHARSRGQSLKPENRIRVTPVTGSVESFLESSAPEIHVPIVKIAVRAPVGRIVRRMNLVPDKTMPHRLRQEVEALPAELADDIARTAGTSVPVIAEASRISGLSFCQAAFLLRELAGFDRSVAGFRLAEQVLLSEPSWADVRLRLAQHNDAIWEALDLDG